jgi:hypothetical protein
MSALCITSLAEAYCVTKGSRPALRISIYFSIVFLADNALTIGIMGAVLDNPLLPRILEVILIKSVISLALFVFSFRGVVELDNDVAW